MVSRRSVWLIFWLVLPLTAAAWPAAALTRGRKQPRPSDSLEWVFASRDELQTTLLAGGDLQPTKQTTVTCQVEDITESDGTMILSVIRNGTQVKKGDELCRLDSSEIEELARLEEIQVNQARASWEQAHLMHETATIALREYQEGLVTQFTKEFEGRLALGRSDTQRQTDRVAWAETMEAKGYLSKSQLLSEKQALAKAQHELRKTEGEYRLFLQFEIPREIKTLRGQIETAEISQRVEADRLKAEQELLAYYRKQIANCIVRAPHDGVVVYANGNRWRSRPLQPGVRFYEGQTMFVLPDLSQMEVEVSVHESVGPRVRVGMKAHVRIASLGNQVLTGRVANIDMLSIPNWKEWDERLRHFVVRVRLDKTPPSALPFMSAAVEIDTGRVTDALLIPVEALAVVGGQQSCYVIADDGLERRAITTRRATMDQLEVIEGLREGERVVLRSRDTFGLAVKETPQDAEIDFARDQSPAPSAPEDLERTTPRAS
jgi:HlyD family secretion protein